MKPHCVTLYVCNLNLLCTSASFMGQLRIPFSAYGYFGQAVLSTNLIMSMVINFFIRCVSTNKWLLFLLLLLPCVQTLSLPTYFYDELK